MFCSYFRGIGLEISRRSTYQRHDEERGDLQLVFWTILIDGEEGFAESEEDLSEVKYNESAILVDLKRMLPVIVMRG